MTLLPNLPNHAFDPIISTCSVVWIIRAGDRFTPCFPLIYKCKRYAKQLRQTNWRVSGNGRAGGRKRKEETFDG